MSVSVIWGLQVLHSAPLLGDLPEEPWGFNPDFKPEFPSVQRHMLAACRTRKEELLIVSGSCWLESFRKWMHGRGEMFPARTSEFQPLVSRFAASYIMPNGVAVKDSMWFDSDSRLRATYMVLNMGVSYASTSVTAAVEYQRQWDEFIQTLNEDAPLGSGEIWHTSRLWIRAEAETAILGSTANTMVVSTGCGFLGALAFTHGNLALSLLVVASVVGVTVSLAWFMSAAMGWATGAVEVLGLIVFVGYSLTYSLHIAHEYLEHTKVTHGSSMSPSERRREAVRHSLKAMAGAVFGSALTTLGSSFFLFFCTIRIFMKLATVLFAVTFFACVFAVAALPSALACVGPVVGLKAGIKSLIQRLDKLSAWPWACWNRDPAPPDDKQEAGDVVMLESSPPPSRTVVLQAEANERHTSQPQKEPQAPEADGPAAVLASQSDAAGMSRVDAAAAAAAAAAAQAPCTPTRMDGKGGWSSPEPSSQTSYELPPCPLDIASSISGASTRPAEAVQSTLLGMRYVGNTSRVVMAHSPTPRSVATAGSPGAFQGSWSIAAVEVHGDGEGALPGGRAHATPQTPSAARSNKRSCILVM